MIIVHVIGPHRSDRHELHFKDGTTDEQILASLRVEDEQKRIPTEYIGVVKVNGVDPETGKPCVLPLRDAQGEAVYVIDHPETVICVGEIYFEKGKKLFRETRRLQGPPLG